MPKKSNKTAHVLSLLTNGAGLPEFSEGENTEDGTAAAEAAKTSAETAAAATAVAEAGQAASAVNAQAQIPAVAVIPAGQAFPGKSRDVVVEVKGQQGNDPLAQQLRANLKKELSRQLDEQIQRKSQNTYIPQETEEERERPPYSKAFAEKFGVAEEGSTGVDLKESNLKNPFPYSGQEEISEETPQEIPENQDLTTENPQDQQEVKGVKSEKYVLENFDSEEDPVQPASETVKYAEGPSADIHGAAASKKEENMANTNNKDGSTFNTGVVDGNYDIDTEGATKSNRIFHNLAEDAMKARAPKVMESMNMCTCQDCVYDVIALALNHTKPLYTVTEKGQLFSKLASYETQYDTDLTSALTKACVKVKLNPRHPGKTDSAKK